MDTTDLTVFFPGLSAHYGYGLPMELKINIKEMKNFASSKAKNSMYMKTNLLLSFYVHMLDGTKELATEVILENLDFGFSAIIDDMKIKP